MEGLGGGEKWLKYYYLSKECLSLGNLFAKLESSYSYVKEWNEYIWMVQVVRPWKDHESECAVGYLYIPEQVQCGQKSGD